MGYFKERLYQQYVILFIFYFMSLAALSSLITVYMRGLGKSGSEISFVLILSNIIALVIQGLIGYSNEKWGTHKTVTIYILISSVISCGLFFFTGNWLFGIVYGLANAITLGLAPLFDVLAANSPYKFGQIRLWGTIGYAAGQQISGSSTILYPQNPFSCCILSAIFPASCSCICCPNRLNRLTLHRICQKRRMKLPEATRSKIYSRTNCSSLICFWRSSFSARTQSTPVICRCF